MLVTELVSNGKPIKSLSEADVGRKSRDESPSSLASTFKEAPFNLNRDLIWAANIKLAPLRSLSMPAIAKPINANQRIT